MNIVKTENGYTFTLSTGLRVYYNGVLIIGGSDDSTQGNLIHTVDEPKTIKSSKFISELDYYQNSISQNRLSIIEYAYELKQLKSKSVNSDEEYAELRFKTDADYNSYMSFISEYQKVYKQIEEVKDIDFVIIHAPLVNNPCIKPARVISAKDFESPLYFYNPNYPLIIRHIAEELGFECVKDETWAKNTKGKFYSYPNHSIDTMEFLKINEQYVFGSNKGLPKNSTYGTLEQCEAKYKEQYNILHSKFQTQLTIIEDLPLSKQAKANIYTLAKSALGHLNNIDPKQKSYQSKQSAIKFINELITALN